MTNIITWFKKFNAEAWKLVQIPGSIPSLGLNYSIFTKPAATPRFTLWYFHGLLDDQTVPIESMFNQDSLVALEEQFGDQFPTIVAVSFGTQWLWTSDPNRTIPPANAVLQNFPKIEEAIRTTHNLPAPYRIAGHSMGGFNAVSLVATYPSYFDRCAVLNPMLITRNPFGDFDIKDLSAPVMRMNFKDAAQYDAQGPFALIQAQTQKLPPFFITATPFDQFNLYPGAQMLAAVLNDRHSPYTWMPHQGDHQHFPGVDIASWLMA